jgi:Tfp pilus assembly protein FimT
MITLLKEHDFGFPPSLVLTLQDTGFKFSFVVLVAWMRSSSNSNHDPRTRGKSGIPVFTKIPKQNSSDDGVSGSDSTKQNGVSSQTTNLDHSKNLTRRDQVMKMRETRIREEETNLTFKPSIQTRGRDTNTVATNSSRFDKLYEEAKVRKEKAKREEKPSFKPKITALGQSKQRSQTPEGTVESLYHSSGAGKKKVEESKVEKSDGFNFQPRISKRGKSLDRNRDVSPSTRLYTQAQISQMKRSKKQEAKLQEEIKDCTFTPQTNSARGKAPAQSSSETSADVTARMEKYQLLREKRIEDLKRAREAEDALVATFKPASYTSNHKVQRSPSRERGDVFTRLHETPRKVSETAEQEWEKEHTFQPTLVSLRAPSVS